MRKLLSAAVALSAAASAAVPARAAGPAGTTFVPFAEFVAGIAAAKAETFVRRPGAAVSNSAEFDGMRRYLADKYAGLSVKHSFVQDEQTFDCVPVGQQSGVRTQASPAIATPPPERPGGPAAAGVTQDAGTVDAFGNAQRCEDGTIPVRRVTLDEVTRFVSLDRFFAKGPAGAGQPRANEPPSYQGHSYAHAYQLVANYGGYSLVNLWRPRVNTAATQIFSLSQQWYVGGSGPALQTAEVGWQNYPRKYGTQSSILFIYWTRDAYARTGCYNLDCAAFVQTSSSWRLGGSFARYSTVGGKQYEVGLGYRLYQGNWWLAAGNDWVGYYPGSVYGGGQLTRYAQEIDFGGETDGGRSWSGMGSGRFASGGFGYAAYQRGIVYRDSANVGHRPTLTRSQPFPSCYTATAPAWGGSAWMTFFYFGGPGGTSC